MEKAKSLLIHDNMSITCISEALGFKICIIFPGCSEIIPDFHLLNTKKL